MDVSIVRLRREGAADDPQARVVLSIAVEGVWYEIGRESANASFDSLFELDYAKLETAPEYAARVADSLMDVTAAVE